MRAGDTVRVLWHDAPVYGTVLPRRPLDHGYMRVLVAGIVMLVEGDDLLRHELHEAAEQHGDTAGEVGGDHAPSIGRANGAGKSAR